jgi:hypothetical protein
MIVDRIEAMTVRSSAPRKTHRSPAVSGRERRIARGPIESGIGSDGWLNAHLLVVVGQVHRPGRGVWI